jgi:hypothetical protein
MRLVLSVMAIVTFAAPALAAELRVEFTELAAIARQSLSDARIRLHNVPQGVLDFSSASYVAIGSTQVPIAIPARPFEAAGGTYAYFVNEINSTAVRVEAADGALKLTLSFESDAPELVGRCTKGLCPPAAALPRIEWSNATVSAELVPVGIKDSLALEAKSVRVGGDFAPVCSTAADFISGGICRSVLKRARSAITKLRGDIDDLLKKQLNKPEVQEKLADSLRKRLVLGPAGEVRVRSVKTDSAGVTVSFCLVCGS